MNEPASQDPRHSCLWWKVAFVVALLAFEMTREMLVLEWYKPPNFAIGTPSSFRAADGSLVTADGRWERTDGGGRLIPAAVSIKCEREIASCTMADTMVENGYIHLPNIMRRTAQFTDTGAEFTDDWPICDQLFVRIDGVHNVTTAVRSSKGSSDPQCKGHDKQIQMRLGGFQEQEYRDLRKNHFTPLVSLIDAILKLF